MQTHYLPEYDAWLHYHDLGVAGPACVYLPGVTASGSGYFPPLVAHPILAGYRSILIDPLGFGYSDRPKCFSYSLEDNARTVASLIDHLGLSTVNVIGHSAGGSVAIVLARLRPDLVGRLVLAEANLGLEDVTFSGTVAAHSEEEYVNHVFPRFLEEMRTGSPGWYGLLRMADPTAIHRTCVSLSIAYSPGLGEQLSAMSMPRFFLIGENTLQDEPHMAKKLQTLPPKGVQVLIIPGVGHDIIKAEDPVACAEAVKSALTADVAAYSLHDPLADLRLH